MNVMSRSFEQDLKRSQERVDTLESERDVLVDELQKCRAKLQAAGKSRSELQESQQELLKAWKTAGEEIEGLKHSLQMEKERYNRAEARAENLERDCVMKSKEVRLAMLPFFFVFVWYTELASWQMENQIHQSCSFQSELEAEVLRLQAELSSTQERVAVRASRALHARAEPSRLISADSGGAQVQRGGNRNGQSGNREARKRGS